MPCKTSIYTHFSTQKLIFILINACYYKIMEKIKIILLSFILTILITGCQTIKEKTENIAEKENKKLSKFIGKSLNNLKVTLGKPDEDYKNEKGNLVLVYNTKKYGIPCERKFEIDHNFTVIGFVSSGCF